MYSDSELDFQLDLQNRNDKNPNSAPNIQKHQKRIVANLIRKGGTPVDYTKVKNA